MVGDALVLGGKGRYEKFLERNGQAATIYALQYARDAHNPKKGMKRNLRGAAVGASMSLRAYGSCLWEDRKSEPEAVQAFVKSLGGGPSNFVSAHRVFTLALLHSRLGRDQPSALADLMENAARLLEADSPWERWVVDFGPVPLTEPQEGEENRHAIFVFGVAQRMIEAALGTEVERAEVARALAVFVPFWTLGVERREAELADNHFAKFVG